MHLSEENDKNGRRQVRRLERKLCEELIKLPQFSSLDYESVGDLDADFIRSYTYPSFSGMRKHLLVWF